jgi:exonuclease SbcC
MQRQIEQAERECAELDLRITALKRQVDDAARKRKTGQGMRDRLAQARQSRNQIEESLKSLPQAMSVVEQCEARIASGEFAPAERQALEAIETQMRALGYDEAEHLRIKERIAELQPAAEKLGRLAAAEENIGKDEEQLQSLAVLLESREQSLVWDREAAQELRLELAELPEVTKRLAEAERAHRRVREEADAARSALGAAQSRLERCKELKQVAAQKRAERNSASRDKTNYEELARIFGKNGIQALIIENAIPEIEAEANAILERMTDNGMKVAFMTQKDTKTAGVAETLDIEISDQMGTRKYELYSGGEALRANFAIRVALSKLLARRAGARLQMLVIDEGFGSQDAEGREKLIDAIHSVQDEFEKILVITHLDELKDAFPARIEVTKDHRGSRATVMA